MADMVQINEDVLARIADILNQKYVRYMAKASNASKPEQKTKYLTKARKYGELMNEVYAVLDPDKDD